MGTSTQVQAPAPRREMPDPTLGEQEFRHRFLAQFQDPAFESHAAELARIATVAWQATPRGRKSRRTRKARRGFADPDYDLAIHWLEGRGAIERAGRAHDDPQGPARFLLINGASRSEHTCPGESSKSWRLLSRPYRNRRAPQRQRPGARSQPSGIGIWPSHISLQDLLFHITRTVSLALFKLMI